MIYLAKGQERRAYLGGIIDKRKTRKDTVDVEILGLEYHYGRAKVRIKDTNVICKIDIRNILSFKDDVEQELKLEALKKKFNGNR